jgi:hypothetical protein
MTHHDLKGAVALVKGGQNRILHVQGVMGVAAEMIDRGKDLFKAHLKQFIF